MDLPPEEAKEERDEHPVRLNGVSLVITPDEKHIEFMDLPSVEKREKVCDHPLGQIPTDEMSSRLPTHRRRRRIKTTTDGRKLAGG